MRFGGFVGLTFVRPGELRHAEWTEFDLAGHVWHIPAAKMKMPRPHKVPLARQAVALIEGSLRDHWLVALVPADPELAQAASDGTLNAALRRIGCSKTQMTAHGFRSKASTLLNESQHWH